LKAWPYKTMYMVASE